PSLRIIAPLIRFTPMSKRSQPIAFELVHGNLRGSYTAIALRFHSGFHRQLGYGLGTRLPFRSAVSRRWRGRLRTAGKIPLQPLHNLISFGDTSKPTELPLGHF